MSALADAESGRCLDPDSAGSLRELKENASRFELAALIKMLFALGFDWSTIQFEGVRAVVSMEGPFIRELRIAGSVECGVVVSLNAGLLGGVSPLPAYFREFGARLADPEAFIAFIGFWDSVQLKDRAVSLLPQLGPSREILARAHLARMNTGSTPFLHQLFRGLFPELKIRVGRQTFERVARGARARVGVKLNGRGVLGARVAEQKEGFTVVLFAESEACEGVSNWESEVAKRLCLVEEVLSRQAQPVEVAVQFGRYLHGQALVSAASGAEARRQLGVRPWLTGVREEAYGPGRVVLRSPWGSARPEC